MKKAQKPKPRKTTPKKSPAKKSALGKRKPSKPVPKASASKVKKIDENQVIDGIANASKWKTVLETADKAPGKNDPKWASLEHKGLIFTPAYEPHGVPILHKGKEIVLRPEEEEIAN